MLIEDANALYQEEEYMMSFRNFKRTTAALLACLMLTSSLPLSLDGPAISQGLSTRNRQP